MARLTGNPVQLVFGAIEECLFLIRDVTAEAALRVLRCGSLERENQLHGGLDLFIIATCCLHPLHVRLSWPVPGLASCPVDGSVLAHSRGVVFVAGGKGSGAGIARPIALLCRAGW